MCSRHRPIEGADSDPLPFDEPPEQDEAVRHPRTYSLVGGTHRFLVTDDESGINIGYADKVGGPLVAPALATPPPAVKDWPDCCTHDKPHHGPVPVGGVHWSDGTDLPAAPALEDHHAEHAHTADGWCLMHRLPGQPEDEPKGLLPEDHSDIEVVPDERRNVWLTDEQKAQPGIPDFSKVKPKSRQQEPLDIDQLQQDGAQEPALDADTWPLELTGHTEAADVTTSGSDDLSRHPVTGGETASDA